MPSLPNASFEPAATESVWVAGRVGSSLQRMSGERTSWTGPLLYLFLVRRTCCHSEEGWLLYTKEGKRSVGC